MKRKVNRVGQNTLTISLPVRWVRNNKIKPGEELEISEESARIIVSRDRQIQKNPKAIVNTDGMPHMFVNKVIWELYRRGVSEIIIKFSKPIYDYKRSANIAVDKYINKIIGRFMGLEIVSQTRHKIVLENLLSAEESQKMNMIQKRSFFLIKDLLVEFLNALDSNFHDFSSKLYDYHDNINKFTYSYMRLVNSSDMTDEDKSRFFALYMIIDKMIDKIRHTGERVDDMKVISPKIKAYLREIFEYFLCQFEMIFRPNMSVSEVQKIIEKRYELLGRVKSETFDREEARVIAECRIILDTIHDFCEAYISLNMNRYITE